MSRGPGRIERAIAAALDGEPDNAFVTDDLVDRVYPGIDGIEKKHRVAVLRAANNLMKRRVTMGRLASDCVGGTMVYYNRDRVLSYAMARLKADFLNHYRSNDQRVRYWTNEEDLRAMLLVEGGRWQNAVVEGAAWWRHTQQAIAEIAAADDPERLARLKAKHKAENERWLADTFAEVKAAVLMGKPA